MKFTISQPDLYALLDVVNQAVDSKPPLPILRNVLLKAEDGILTATGTNVALTIYSSAKCVVAEPGSITLPAQNLYALVRAYRKDDPVTITLDAENVGVRITSGRAKDKLNGILASEFPLPKSGDSEYEIRLSPGAFAEAITRTIYAVEPNANEPHRRGLALVFADDELILYSNDHTRLALAKLKLDEPAPAAMELIIPRDSLVSMTKLLAKREGELTLSISRDANGSPTMLHIDGDAISISSQILDGNFYIPLAKILPDQVSTHFRFSQSDLLRALDRMAVFATDANNVCRVIIDETGMAVSAHSRERGAAEDFVDGEFSGDELSLLLRIDYLTDALRSFPSEVVDLKTYRLGDKSWEIAIAIECDDDPSGVAMISPMSG